MTKFNPIKLVCMVILAVIGGVLLSSCQAMSASDCLATDWQFKGEDDGLNGLPVSTFQTYKEQCFKHSVLLSSDQMSDYESGLNVGYQTFCRRNNGYTQGARGKANHDVCPQNLRAEFNRSYSMGRVFNSERKKVNKVQSDIDNRNRRIRNIQSSIKSLQKTAYSSDTDEKTQASQQKKIDDLQNEVNQILVGLQPLYTDRYRAQDQCEEVRRRHQRQGYPVPAEC